MKYLNKSLILKREKKDAGSSNSEMREVGEKLKDLDNELRRCRRRVRIRLMLSITKYP